MKPELEHRNILEQHLTFLSVDILIVQEYRILSTKYFEITHTCTLEHI